MTDTVRALACVIDATIPTAYREAQREIAALRDEVHGLRAQIAILRENIRQDRDSLEEPHRELAEALYSNHQLTTSLNEAT